MSKTRSYVLSLAGFDPSGGAGLAADIKTFEAHKVMGLGVCTALTVQNDEAVDAVDWISYARVIDQIDVLFRRFDPEVAKIGIIENVDVLKTIVSRLHRKNPRIKIVWDPVLKASEGFAFHTLTKYPVWSDQLDRIYLLTPNWVEMEQLIQADDAYSGAAKLSAEVNVFLKGGHNEEFPGRDYLFLKKGKVFPLNAKKIASSPKHGSGCVLSAAIAANLARGFRLHRACLRAKSYVTAFLLSNQSLLGYHKI